MADTTLPMRTSSDTSGEVQRILKKLEANGRDLRVARLLANSGNGFRPYVLMSDALLNRAALPARLREVAILAVAARLGAHYEWKEHVQMSRAAGVTDEQRAAIRAGDYSSCVLSDDERYAIGLALKILASEFTLDDWGDAAGRLGRDALLDLIFTVGWWGGFMYLVIDAIADHGLKVSSPALDNSPNYDYDYGESLREGLGG